MLALIKREIYDHLVYFIAALFLSFITITIISYTAYYTDLGGSFSFIIGFLFFVFFAIIIGFTGMGVTQMYSDKNKRISTFLSTLSVTRNRILTARIIAGILAILTYFLPVFIAAIVMYRLLSPPLPVFKTLFFHVYTVTILISFACYCIGLQTGWTAGKLAPTLGGLILACIFASIIKIKGFDSQVSLLLIIFIIASLIRIRQKFMSTSL